MENLVTRMGNLLSLKKSLAKTFAFLKLKQEIPKDHKPILNRHYKTQFI